MALVKKRRLRTGTSVWVDYPHRLPLVSRIKRSFKTDILVVGAGISGSLVACTLAASGNKVAIIDRRGPALGSTPASTALLQFEIDTPLLHLKRKIGAAPAERAWVRSKESLDCLRTLIRKTLGPAAISVRNSVYMAGNVLPAREMIREARARQRIGLPSQYLTRTQLQRRFRLTRAGAIVSSDNLAADPIELTTGFIGQAQHCGARLFSPHEIVDVQAARRSVLAGTADGFEIQARKVVLCTGYELPKIVPVAGHRLASTWAIATRAQPKRLWPEQCFIWEASTPYLYARTTFDGRVICGGEDEEFVDENRRDAKLSEKTNRIQNKLQQLLPAIDARPVFRWTGTFGESATGLPSIGEIPGYANCFAVLGFGGNGITFSMLAAQLISAAIRGRKDPDARLFAFR